jgi:hypothetical protein
LNEFRVKTFIDLFALFMLTVFAICALLYLGFLGYYLLFPSRWSDARTTKILANGASTLGLPFAALGSFVIVWILYANAGGDLSFKGLSIEIKGPASALMYWIFTYLTFVVAIRAAR